MAETNAKHARPPEQRTRRWKRTAVILLLLLVGGAIVNVAVAWGCTFLPTSSATRDADWDRFVESSWLKEIQDRSNFRPESLGFERSFASEFWHVRGRTQIADDEEPRGAVSGLQRSGWPAMSLSGRREVIVEAGKSYQVADSSLVGAIALSDRIADNTMAILPLQPIWPGSIFNTLFYAALLWLLVCGRRVLAYRRGLCENCAYPIGTSPVCTECGEAVQPSCSASVQTGRPLPRIWRPKRRACMALLLLAGGAIVNVAVAWALATFASSPYSGGHRVPNAQQEALWHAHLPSHLDSTLRMAAQSQSPYLDAHIMMGSASPTLRPDFDEAGMMRTFSVGRNDEINWSYIVQSGWPMRCFAGARWILQRPLAPLVSVEAALVHPRDDVSEPFVSALAVPRPTRSGTEYRLLPLGVLWPGFLFNTLIYALLLWLIFFLLFTTRRTIRRRRGLCEKCAYPVGVSPVCTECGAVVRIPQNRTSKPAA